MGLFKLFRNHSLEMEKKKELWEWVQSNPQKPYILRMGIELLKVLGYFENGENQSISILGDKIHENPLWLDMVFEGALGSMINLNWTPLSLCQNFELVHRICGV